MLFAFLELFIRLLDFYRDWLCSSFWLLELVYPPRIGVLRVLLGLAVLYPDGLTEAWCSTVLLACVPLMFFTDKLYTFEWTGSSLLDWVVSIMVSFFESRTGLELPPPEMMKLPSWDGTLDNWCDGCFDALHLAANLNLLVLPVYTDVVFPDSDELFCGQANESLWVIKPLLEESNWWFWALLFLNLTRMIV